MSTASPQPDAAWRPICKDHEGPPTRKVTAILKIRFPLGSLPVRGFRCPVCGSESLLASEAQEAQDLARELGLFSVTNRRRRKLLRTGNSIAVSLDPELLREVLPGRKPGDAVFVGRMGDRIVIERA